MKCILLVLAISLDAFVASIAYGSKKIKIPLLSTLIINIICSLLLAVSVLLGSQLKRVLPGNITALVSFLILLLLGIFYLFEGLTKNYLWSRVDFNKEIELKLSDINFIINIYLDQTKADYDYSKKLDYKEALYLGFALSLDSLTIGFGSGLTDINYAYLLGLSLIVGLISIRAGLLIGEKLAIRSKLNLSWLAGVILIFLALSRLF